MQHFYYLEKKIMANLHGTVTAFRFPDRDAGDGASLADRLLRLLEAALDRAPRWSFIP